MHPCARPECIHLWQHDCISADFTDAKNVLTRLGNGHPFPLFASVSARRSCAGQVAGATDVRGTLAAMTQGGGKSLLPVIAAARLMAASVVERVCWIVPRDSLRLQTKEALAEPAWGDALRHDVSIRAADNHPTLPRAGGLCHDLPSRRRRAEALPRRFPASPFSARAGRGAPSSIACGRRGRMELRRPAPGGNRRAHLLLSGTLEFADARVILYIL